MFEQRKNGKAGYKGKNCFWGAYRQGVKEKIESILCK